MWVILAAAWSCWRSWWLSSVSRWKSGDLFASAAEPVGKQGRQAGPGGEFVVDVVELGAQRGEVIGGERDVAAFQRAALAQPGPSGAALVTVGLAERLVGSEDAGGEGAGTDRGVLAAHEPGDAARVGEDGPREAGLVVEAGVLVELGQPAFGFDGGGAGEVGVLVGIDHRPETLAAGACSDSTSARNPESEVSA